jgi:hypothetical protein
MRQNKNALIKHASEFLKDILAVAEFQSGHKLAYVII